MSVDYGSARPGHGESTTAASAATSGVTTAGLAQTQLLHDELTDQRSHGIEHTTPVRREGAADGRGSTIHHATGDPAARLQLDQPVGERPVAHTGIVRSSSLDRGSSSSQSEFMTSSVRLGRIGSSIVTMKRVAIDA